MLAAFLAMQVICVSAQQLSFPGAQGWGRYATGGRTGTVYHVTNLNDSGTGSLRDAVSQPNRIVVFDVAGVINITSRIVFKNNLYVAGQTAPGEGITVYGDGVSFSGANNIIVRYMRFRMGHKGTSGKDAAGLANGANMIFDHCSFSWGQDETFSINPDGKGTTPQNITLQHCIVGQGLMTHSAGGLMQTDYVSLIGNLLCDNSTRNFKVKGINQYANNMVYNWKNGAYIMGGDSEGKSYVNIQSNLFINGPAVGGAAFTGGNSDFHCYADDNWQDSNRDGVFNPSIITDYNAATRETTPYAYPELTLNPGKTLLETNLPTVGASLPYRDMADCYMVDEVLSFGKNGALISNEESLPYGAPNTWNMWGGNNRIDTDHDGMPDEWETANGTDPSLDDAMTIASNGYANIENYINSITMADRDYFLRRPMCLELAAATTTTLKVTWCDYTFEEDGFIVEINKGNGFQEAGRTAAGATFYTFTGLESGKTYSIRVRAFAGTDHLGDYSATLSADTRLPETGLIDIDRYEPEAVNELESNKNILIDSPTDMTFPVNETITPTNVVVNSLAHITISGSGSIGGTGTMNKAGEGTLTVSTANTYTGATVLHEGIFEFNSLKNGGVASGLGAGIKDAQNWIMDGGTYLYTGGTTSTDRSARLMRPTSLNIASGTVTMTGSIEGTNAQSNFILDGKGQLSVASTNFFKYNGATVLRGGTLYLSTADIANAGIGSSSKLIMAGGTLKTKGESENYETYTFPIEVTEGTTSIFAPNRNCYMNNTLTGSGDLQINIPYVREYVKFNLTNFHGKLIANGVGSGALFLINKGLTDLSHTVIECKGTARVCYWDTYGSLKLGGLSGTSGTYLMGSSKNTSNFTCKWTVGSANTDETFRGIINNFDCSGNDRGGTVSIEKVGTGDWRLTGNNPYKGTTVVSGGRLIVNGTHSGTGAISVKNSATLAGKGSLTGTVTVQSGGTLQPGDTLVLANQFKLNGKLTMLSGSILEIPALASGRTNYVNASGTAAFNGVTLFIHLSDASSSIATGTQFRVFRGTATGTGFTEILPERPSPTQLWDTSMLLSNGIVTVVDDATAITTRISTPDYQDKKLKRYNTSGQAVSGSAQGIFIQNGKKYLTK